MIQVDDRNILDKFVIDFCNILEKHAKYIVVSGFFAIASGRTRGTEDVDLIFEKLSFDKFKKLHEDLVKNGFNCIQEEDPEEIYSYLEEKLAVRYIFKDNESPNMEIKFVKDGLDEYQINHRQKYSETNLDVWFAPLECCVAFKEDFLKSKKDLEDARHLRIFYQDILDEKKVLAYKDLIKRYRYA
jgi:hypothetical protein